jgi:hypothetical protein
MTKEEILIKARDLVSTDRNKTHGDAYKNHADIAEYWNIFLDDKLKAMANITPSDVALTCVVMQQ